MCANVSAMAKDTAISFRLPADLKAALQVRADAEQRSLAQYVTIVLQRHVDDTPAPKSKKS
jgi:predicted HicB family RNase H-like nuclease